MSNSNQPDSTGRHFPLSESVVGLNIVGPLISEGLAQKLGFIILQDKYPKPIFSPHQPGIVVDQGDAWLVIFENALVSPDDLGSGGWPWPEAAGMPVPRRLGITIRKSNGEIVGTSSPREPP